jgi:putative peptidoglycan lipid II flippase
MLLGDWFSGSTLERMIAVVALVGAGFLVYFPVAWMIGAMDREDVMLLFKRKKAA